MLKQFTIGNWASFKNPVTFSLEGSSDTEHEETNILRAAEERLLRSAVVYGANASGKSNLIAGLTFARSFVLTSSKEGQVEEDIAAEPFRLSTDTEAQPSYFETVFYQDGTQF